MVVGRVLMTTERAQLLLLRGREALERDVVFRIGREARERKRARLLCREGHRRAELWRALGIRQHASDRSTLVNLKQHSGRVRDCADDRPGEHERRSFLGAGLPHQMVGNVAEGVFGVALDAVVHGRGESGLERADVALAVGDSGSSRGRNGASRLSYVNNGSKDLLIAVSSTFAPSMAAGARDNERLVLPLRASSRLPDRPLGLI